MVSDKDIPTNLNENEEELLEISRSIEHTREKLNKMIEEGLISNKETIEVSQHLDKLILEYYHKSIKLNDNN